MRIKTLRHSWLEQGKAIAKQPLCKVAIAVFFYFVLAGVDKHILEGRPMRGVLSWMGETVLAAPDKPLVQIALIVLAIWMFARGIKKIERAQANAATNQIDAEKRETKIREDLIRTVLNKVQSENEALKGHLAALMEADTNRMEDLRQGVIEALLSTYVNVMHPFGRFMLEVANAKEARLALQQMPTEQSIDQRLSVFDPQMPAVFDEHIYLVRQEFDKVKKSLPFRLDKATDILDFNDDRIMSKLENQISIERGSENFKKIVSLYRDRAELAASIREALEKSENQIEELSALIRSAT
jgi:hypothetical protein